jgi:hypothetical protein
MAEDVRRPDARVTDRNAPYVPDWTNVVLGVLVQVVELL